MNISLNHRLIKQETTKKQMNGTAGASYICLGPLYSDMKHVPVQPITKEWSVPIIHCERDSRKKNYS